MAGLRTRRTDRSSPTIQTPGGTPPSGIAYVSARTAGTSFSITSKAGDTLHHRLAGHPSRLSNHDCPGPGALDDTAMPPPKAEGLPHRTPHL
jgi:hypothetical protein